MSGKQAGINDVGGVQSIKPIVKSGGEAPTSFEELEAITLSPKPKPEPKKADKRDDDQGDDGKSSREPKKIPKNDTAHETDDAGDGKKTGKKAKESGDADDAGEQEEEVEEQEEEQEEAETDSATKDPVDPKNGKPKLVKVRAGDEEVDLPSDAKLTVKVDGKLQEVSVQDLLSEYSGKTDWNRRYSELETQRQTFERDRAPVNQLLDGFLEKTEPEVMDADPLAPVKFLAEQLGADPDAIEEKIRAKLLTEFEELSQLSPEERRIKDLERKNKKITDRQTADRTTRERERLSRNLETRLEATVKKHGLTYAELLELDKELRASGSFKEDQITPELVGEFYAEKKARTGLVKLIDEAVKDLEPAKKAEALNYLRKVQIENPDFTDEDMKGIIAQLFGNQAAARASKKLAQRRGGGTPSPKPAPKKVAITFDDL